MRSLASTCSQPHGAGAASLSARVPSYPARRRCAASNARSAQTVPRFQREDRPALATDCVDLVLSSGFLAFAGHAGFLEAVEEAGLTIGGVMGTSAGALAGSLYCAGYSPRQVAKHLSEQTPATLLRPSLAPWRGGALSLDGVIERLRDLLPSTFEDLPREFAVGVVTADGQHLIIDSGPLAEAVAASAAIPLIFQGVDVPGLDAHGPLKDGGVVDRLGLRAWRNRRRAQITQQPQSYNGEKRDPPPCLVHMIERSSPFSGADDAQATGEKRVLVCRSPRSQANFFDLGHFDDHMATSKDRARSTLRSGLRALGPTAYNGKPINGMVNGKVNGAVAVSPAIPKPPRVGGGSKSGAPSRAVIASAAGTDEGPDSVIRTI